MKAAVFRGPGSLELEERSIPAPGDGEVVVRVHSNTICGTDLRIANGSKTKGILLPRVLGHELAGEVSAIGNGVTQVAVGDRVGMTPSVSCLVCDQCQSGRSNLCPNAEVLGHQIDGGLAEYILVPAPAVRAGNLAVALPEVPYEAISLAEPLSCVINGQAFLEIDIDQVVLIIGGGAIGLLHAQLAKASGARTVILSEPVASRRELAQRLGVDVTLDPTTEDLAAIVSEHTDGAGADVVIVCIGVPALVNTALASAKPRGRVSLFAGFPPGTPAPIDANLIHYRELFVVGSSNSTTHDYRRALRLIESGQIDVLSLVTHRFELDQIAEAFAAASYPDALKVTVQPATASTR